MISDLISVREKEAGLYINVYAKLYKKYPGCVSLYGYAYTL
ncbi:MAG: hypothetical protein K0R84_548 [Clostridia bacterium]|jgi:hypothetical protein|nr:hypothetical protein [Clostridia bacterium]